MKHTTWYLVVLAAMTLFQATPSRAFVQQAATGSELNRRGIELAAEGDLEAALEAFLEAVKLDPELAQAWLNMGIVLSGLERHGEAIDSYREAVRLKPDYAEAHYRLGHALYGQGNGEEAVRALRDAVRARPGYPEAYFSLGQLLFMQGRVQESIRAFEAAVFARPDYTEAYLAIGNIWASQDQLEPATRAYEKAVSLSPDNAEAHFRYAVTLYGTGDYAKAWEHVHKAQDLALEVNASFLEVLREAMPEPKRKKKKDPARTEPIS